MHVPIDDRNSLDLFVTLLRVTRSDRNVIEETETHGSFRRGMMPWWAHRHECILRGAFHQGIDSLASSARPAHGGFQRMDWNQRVGIEVTSAFADGLFDVFEVLRSVTGLNFCAARLFGLNLNYSRLQFRVASEGVHNDAVTLCCFRMPGSSVMLLKNRMMNNRRCHLGRQTSVGELDWRFGCYLLKSVRPGSITHVGRRSVEEFLRQAGVETLQNYELTLGPRFVTLFDVEQPQIIMRGRVVVLESNRRTQLFHRQRKTMQLQISKA